MRYGKRSFFKRISTSPLAIVAVFIVLTFLARAVWNINSKVKTSALKLNQAQTELSKLQTHQVDISNEVSKLSTNEGIESELHTKYRAVKNGESVAVIVGDTDSASSSNNSSRLGNDLSANAGSADSSSWWQRMLQTIGL